MSLFLFCVTAHDFFRMQKTMEQTVYIFRTVDMKWLEQKKLNIGLQTKIVGFIATLTYHAFKCADTEDSEESNTVHNPTKFGAGVLIKVLYDASETLPRGPTPYPLLYAFWQKKKRPKKANRCILWLSKSRKTLWFCDLFVLKRQCIYSS